MSFSDAQFFTDGHDIYLMTGNPGVIEMYRFFMQNLYNETKIPVFGVSHVGHIKTQVHKVRGPMTLHKQIEHKVDFIERFIPRDVEIILVGHSIGAYMANQIMRLASDKSRFYHNFQLFPTIERMAETKGARVMSPLFFFKYLVMPIIFILSLLKDEILIQMIIMFIDDARRCPRCIIAGFLQVVNARCLKNIVDMAQDEFRQVQERNDRFISQELSKLTFVYCPEDRWAPLSYYRDLKRSYPRGDIILMNTAIHAFVTDMHVTKSIIDLITNRIEVKIREEEDGVNGFSGSNHCVSQQILVE